MANPPDGETTLIAQEGRKIVGFCRAIKHPDRNQIYAIYVCLNIMAAASVSAMWQKAQQHLDCIVEVATYNTKAIKFYARLGFTDTGKRMSDRREGAESHQAERIQPDMTLQMEDTLAAEIT